MAFFGRWLGFGGSIGVLIKHGRMNPHGVFREMKTTQAFECTEAEEQQELWKATAEWRGTSQTEARASSAPVRVRVVKVVTGPT